MQNFNIFIFPQTIIFGHSKLDIKWNNKLLL